MTHAAAVATEEASAGPGERRSFRPLAGALLRVGLLLPAWVLVLVVHGFVPGSSQAPLTALSGAGAIQCLHDQGIASLWTWCMSTGVPVGTPRLTGLPQVQLGWALAYLPGVDAWDAHQLSSAVFVGLGLACGYLLGRRWGLPPWLAVLAATSFLVAPNVTVLNGFVYTFLGYMLLPAYTYACVRTLDLVDSGRWLVAGAWAAGTALLMAFTDGYSFLSAALVIGVLVLAWAWRTRGVHGWPRALGGGGMWLASLGGAAAAYASWAPGAAYETDVPLETFALLAVDVVTLVTPSSYFLFPGVLGVSAPNPAIWGIAETKPTHYLGVLTLVAAVALVGVLIRREPSAPRRELLALGVAGAVALLLSFGPTLKVGQVDPGLAAAAAQLPTSWVYENVPGFSEMRATSRWLIVTRFALIFLAAAGIRALAVAWARTPVRRVGVVVLALAMVLETAPSASRVVSERSRSVDRVHYVRELTAEADALLRDDEHVLALPSNNDFLTEYLVPMVGVTSFNTGGDKNYELALDAWPSDVRALRETYGPEAGDALCEVLTDEADAVLLSYESLWAVPLLHVRDPEGDEARRWIAGVHAADPRFVAEVGEHFTVLRRSEVPCDA